jgi:hypothetical protein
LLEASGVILKFEAAFHSDMDNPIMLFEVDKESELLIILIGTLV